MKLFDLDDPEGRRDALAYLSSPSASIRRNSEQNALLHALLTEIAGAVEWAGQKRDVETWKRLCTAAWLRAQGESVEVLPAIDGHGIDVVFRRTSNLTKAQCASLIDFVTAWAAEQGVFEEAPA